MLYTVSNKRMKLEECKVKMSETAKKNHDELFPGHVSILAEKDPEFIEVFDNFAFRV